MFSRDLYHSRSEQLWGVVVIGTMDCTHTGRGTTFFDFDRLNFTSSYTWLDSNEEALVRAEEEVQAKVSAGWVETEQSLTRRSFEQTRGQHRKFWIIELDGASHLVRYGRIQANRMSCADPRPMLEFLGRSGKASKRRLWLLIAAWGRRIMPVQTDDRSRRAFEVVERHADGLATKRQVNTANLAASGAYEAILFRRGGKVAGSPGRLMPPTPQPSPPRRSAPEAGQHARWR